MDIVRFREDICKVGGEFLCGAGDFVALGIARGSMRLLEVRIAGAALMDNFRGLEMISSVDFRLSDTLRL